MTGGEERTAGDDTRTDRPVRVREADAGELTDVLNVLDGAALATDADLIAAGVDRGDVLVAAPAGAGEGEAGGPVLGALVLDGEEIEAVAVRRRRRGQGIGTGLVAAAAERRDRLVATFDAGVRPFYERLGFEIEPIERGADAESSRRYRGRLDADDFDR